MANQEIEAAQDNCDIPKWGPKKGLRYEVDDFIVSPPSNEDGGFFHLRYGQRSKPRSSTYDRINEELSMTVEIKDGDPMIADLNLSGLEKEFEKPTISITPTGIFPTKLPNSTPTPETSSSHSSTKPLFVWHLKNSKPRVIEDSEELNDSSADPSPTTDLDLEEALSQLPLQQSEVNASPVSDSGKRIENAGAEEQAKKIPKPETKLELKILEKVYSLKIASPVELAPFKSPLTTPLTTPLSTPHSSPTAKRKVAGVVMDQAVKNSYFCTKAFQGSQQSSGASAFGSGIGSATALSSTTAQMSENMECGAKAALAMDPGQKLGKKRKPKPSTLREMNFWAPTSM